MPKILPTDIYESELLADFEVVVGIDEVGRGAVAGPVTVGAAAIIRGYKEWPKLLADSKMVVKSKHQELALEAKQWLSAWAVASISAADIVQHGITKALGRAGALSLEELFKGRAASSVAVILDGSSDWLSAQSAVQTLGATVFTRTKADRDCVVVSAASIIAKQHRDSLMSELAERFPAYGWHSNAGYGSQGHFDAIREFGVTEHHRTTWLRKLEFPV